MQPTRISIVARSQPTESQSADHQTDSSLFTFIIALLVLIFASGALVLRALLLRRHRRVQAALNSFILPNRPFSPERKPELSEVWVYAPTKISEWHALMPLCATKVVEYTDCKPPPAARPMTYRPSPAGRLMELLGHHPVVTAVVVPPHERRKATPKHATVQVTVLIAMPVEHSLVSSKGQLTPPISPKGKQRDSIEIHENVVPDVALGVTNFPSSRNDFDDL